MRSASLLILPALALQHSSEDCAAEQGHAALATGALADEAAAMENGFNPTCDDGLWFESLKLRGEQCCSSGWKYLGMACPYELHEYRGFGSPSSHDYREWWRKWCRGTGCSQCQTGCCCPRKGAKSRTADFDADLAAHMAAATDASDRAKRQPEQKWDELRAGEAERARDKWKRDQDETAELLRRAEAVTAEAHAALRESEEREKRKREQARRERLEQERRHREHVEAAMRAEAQREREARARPAAEVPEGASASKNWTSAQQAQLKALEAELKKLRTMSPDEKQRGLRKLAMKWHPDRVADEDREFATHMFQRLNYKPK